MSPFKGPSRDGTIGEDTIRASLISAVSDKLRWRMKEEMDRAQAELDALKRTEEDLKKGHQKLEEMVSRLDQEVVRGSCVAVSPLSFFFSLESLSHQICCIKIQVSKSQRCSSTRQIKSSKGSNQGQGHLI